MLANVHRDPEKTAPYSAVDFHPYGRSLGKRAAGTPLTGARIREKAARWRAEREAQARVEVPSE